MASVSVLLPAALRTAAAGSRTLTVEAQTVWEALAALTSSHPQLGRMIFVSEGRVRPHVRLFVGDRQVTGAVDAGESLGEGDELRIVPAIAGG